VSSSSAETTARRAEAVAQTTHRPDAPICDGITLRVDYGAGEIDGDDYGRRRTRFFEVR
jgi:hypothetical protein